MSIFIRNLHIENFRSIRKLSIPVGKLSVLVGKNDSGKSNILRAVNLFFNERTNHQRPLTFGDDFNFFYRPPAQKAKEIIVRLELDIPESYRATNGSYIVWEKRWRSGGLHSDDYWGVRESEGPRGRHLQEIIQIPQKSNLHSLLKKIRFQYVPAIKDAMFFDELRGRIYEIISEVANDTFRTSSSSFEQSIGQHLQDLTTDIASNLHLDTRLALPRDLSHIFEKLDFLSGASSVSLDNRGDGVKARHIPLILKFMGDKMRSLAGRGAMPYSFIWGYEEPENNLELTNCVALADAFFNYANNGTAQILLTTHSPVFYNLRTRLDAQPTVHDFHVYKEVDVDGTKAEKSTNELDEKMGTMAMLAPQFVAIEKKVREQEKARHDAQTLIASNRRKLFVEGESDQIILSRAIELFAPSQFNEIDLQSKSPGGGHTYVIDMLQGWRSEHKHYPSRHKSAGVIDCDDDAVRACTDFNEIPGNVDSAKCFKLPKPRYITPALASGFKIPVCLEVLYPASVWQDSLNRGHLVERRLVDVIPDQLLEQYLRASGNVVDAFDPAWAIYARYEYDWPQKVSTARRIVRKSDADARQTLAEFAPLIAQLIAFLFPTSTPASNN